MQFEMNDLKSIIEEVYFKEKKNQFTFLTGAGISSDSGIPTYRGSDGIWIKGSKFYKPEEFGTLKYFLQNPEEVWQYMISQKIMFKEAEPNDSHFAIREIEKLLGERFNLITQNVDNLHRKVGVNNILEIHGNYNEVKCSNKCKDILPFPENIIAKGSSDHLLQKDKESLTCLKCGSWLRPNLLWFDEEYDEKTNKKVSSLKIAKFSGVLFVIGTSGATNLPIQLAKTTLKFGGYVIDINIEDNHFTRLLQNKKRGLIIREKSDRIINTIKGIIKNCIEQSI